MQFSRKNCQDFIFSLLSGFRMSGQQPLDIAEWEQVVGKMLKFHDNISKEIGALVIKIKTEMKPDLVPVAEEKANYGKVTKWSHLKAPHSPFLSLCRSSSKPLGRCGLWNTRLRTSRKSSLRWWVALTSTTSPMTSWRTSCSNLSLSKAS